MKLVSYLQHNSEKLGLYINERIYGLKEASEACGYKDLPSTIELFLKGEEDSMDKARHIEEKLKTGKILTESFEWKEVEIMAPVPHPTSCRDGYAFRQHVAAARRNRSVEMITEFDEYPIFYFNAPMMNDTSLAKIASSIRICTTPKMVSDTRSDIFIHCRIMRGNGVETCITLPSER